MASTLSRATKASASVLRADSRLGTLIIIAKFDDFGLGGVKGMASRNRDCVTVRLQTICHNPPNRPTAAVAGMRSFGGRTEGKGTRGGSAKKLLFETRAQVTDKEILATARRNARVKVFAGRELSGDIVDRINEAVADGADQLIVECVLPGRHLSYIDVMRPAGVDAI